MKKISPTDPTHATPFRHWRRSIAGAEKEAASWHDHKDAAKEGGFKHTRIGITAVSEWSLGTRGGGYRMSYWRDLFQLGFFEFFKHSHQGFV
jgi:hypothetical protein